jgi:ATP-dependent Zn protease
LLTVIFWCHIISCVLEQLARGTPGFTGADLSNLVNQAAVHASMKGLVAVDMKTFEYAKDKLLVLQLLS